MEKIASTTEHDRDLAKRVSNYLATRHFPNLTRLQIEAENGLVTMRGRVDSFHEKQVAIHSCRRVAGVLKLVDNLTVS